MNIAFDLDETLCTGYPYEIAIPKPGARELLLSLKKKGHTVKIYTARGMGRSAGNVDQAVATIGALTIAQLKEWDFVYDELHFGKQSYDIFFDDKAYNGSSLEEINLVLKRFNLQE